MHRTIEQRHTNLGNISRLTTAAASVAFAHGDYERALEWLEQGRCLVWSQLNQLRTPVDTLREHDEHLAQRFLDVSGALESSGSRSGLGSLGIDAPMSHKITLQSKADAHVKLAREWTNLLDEIRSVPGFHDFLRPPKASELLKNLPHDGPIILVNIHESRCDALALISDFDMPVHIPLDNFSYKQASDLKERLHNFLLSKRVRMREVQRAGRPVQPRNIEKQSDMHFVLKELWVRVVRPILDGLSYSVSSTPIENITPNLIGSRKIHHQSLVEFGGVQLVLSRSSHFTPREFTIKMSGSHPDHVSQTLQYPRIPRLSVRSSRSSRDPQAQIRYQKPAYSLSVNRPHPGAPQFQARQRK